VLIYLLQGAALALYATIAPGPLQAFLLAQALKHGWKRTMPIAFVPLVTDGPISVLVLLLLSQTPQWFLSVLRIAGGLFILYLAYKIMGSLKEAMTLEPSAHAASKGFLSAVVINFLNPHPYIFWGVVGGPILLTGWRESPLHGIGFIVGFYGTFICGLAGLILLFATAGRLDPRLNRILSGISGIVLSGFGLYQIVAGMRNFL
jgi:threonine/homoserine/homoserine lactone efflux protein